MNRLLLVRHTEVARHWRGRCYGQSDVGLSRLGVANAQRLAERLAGESPAHIIHSGLRRTALLATLAGRLAGVIPCADTAWGERDFGEWEGRSWHRIWKETGHAMQGMIDDPQGFRPSGGETTAMLIARVQRAAALLPANGTVLVISHGGPIAALLWQSANLPISRLPDFIPGMGTIVEHVVLQLN